MKEEEKSTDKKEKTQEKQQVFKLLDKAVKTYEFKQHNNKGRR